MILLVSFSIKSGISEVSVTSCRLNVFGINNLRNICNCNLFLQILDFGTN